MIESGVVGILATQHRACLLRCISGDQARQFGHATFGKPPLGDSP